jgi:hypothetical protein
MFKPLIILFLLTHAQAETPSTSEYTPTATPDPLMPRDDPPEFSAYIPTESQSFGTLVVRASVAEKPDVRVETPSGVATSEYAPHSNT